MIQRLLAPFTSEHQRRGWRTWAWLVFFLGAPLAYWGALHLQQRPPNAPRFESEEAIRRAALQAAADLGVNASGWKEIKQVFPGDDLPRVIGIQRMRGRDPELRRWTPIAWVRVTLLGPERKWIQVWLRPDASVAGFRTSNQLLASGESVTDEQARAFAASAFREAIGPTAWDWGAPTVETESSARWDTIRRYEWKIRPPGYPEIEATAVVKLIGNRVMDRWVRARVIPGALPPPTRRENLTQVIRQILSFALVLYAGYRFARRAFDQEVPFARCAVIFGLQLLFAFVTLAFHPFFRAGELTGDQLASPLSGVLAVNLLINIALQGILVAIAYGAGEGDLREIFTGRLTSLDAFLTGRLWARKLGGSIVVGAAASGWTLLAIQLIERFVIRRPGRPPFDEIEVFYSPWGFAQFVLREPLVAFVSIAFGLFIPLMFANRWMARRPARLLVTVILAILMMSAVWANEPGEPFGWVRALVLTAALLLSFWFFDVVAAQVVILGVSAIDSITELAQFLPSASAYVPALAGLALLTILIALALAYVGRAYSDEEVRPQYASRLAERLTLKAEVSSAREAQLRLLPDSLPRLPGVTLAASCDPAQEVGGDFYDFVPLSRGRTGMLLAEGGAGGLASALTMGLAKGFLTHAAQRDWTPREALDRLAPVLGANPSVKLCYAIVDPALRQVRIARLGDWPRLLRVRSAFVEELGPDARITLEPGEALVCVTDGLTARLEAKQGVNLESWLRNHAGGFADASTLHKALRGSADAAAPDLNDDVTMVVFAVDAASSQLQEATA
jgi:hypothetical protein